MSGTVLEVVCNDLLLVVLLLVVLLLVVVVRAGTVVVVDGVAVDDVEGCVDVAVVVDVFIENDDVDVVEVDDRDVDEVVLNGVRDVVNVVVVVAKVDVRVVVEVVNVEVVDVEVVDVDVVVVVVSHPLHVLSHWSRACPHNPCDKIV